MKKKLSCYVATHRRSWCLTQRELARLVGTRGHAVVSLVELAKRPPTAKMLFALEIIFGVPASDLFPKTFSAIEEEVLTRAYELYVALDGKTSKIALRKRDLLADALERRRTRGQPDV